MSDFSVPVTNVLMEGAMMKLLANGIVEDHVYNRQICVCQTIAFSEPTGPNPPDYPGPYYVVLEMSHQMPLDKVGDPENPSHASMQTTSSPAHAAAAG
jgi:hypothetical protein